MSANQIPAPFPTAALDWPNRPRLHSCTSCWMNGGEGHTLAELIKLAPADADEPRPAIAAPKVCTYWSAAAQEHCTSTHRVQLHGGLGLYCGSHNPANWPPRLTPAR